MFTGKEDHRIGLKKARALIRSFQKNMPKKEVKALYFSKEAVSMILRQKGCVGLRIYHAKKTSGARTLILAGIDKMGNDMVDGYLAEFGYPCPPYCPPDDNLAPGRRKKA